jgi:hypothetical protein
MLATACSIQSIVANDVILTSTIYLLAIVIALKMSNPSSISTESKIYLHCKRMVTRRIFKSEGPSCVKSQTIGCFLF